MEKIEKRPEYQQIGKGKVIRRMNKLTVQDYFAAGGSSVKHYNSVTLMKEIDLKTLDAKALELIIYALVATRRIVKPEKPNKDVMIKIISEVQ